MTSTPKTTTVEEPDWPRARALVMRVKMLTPGQQLRLTMHMGILPDLKSSLLFRCVAKGHVRDESLAALRPMHLRDWERCIAYALTPGPKDTQ